MRRPTASLAAGLAIATLAALATLAPAAAATVECVLDGAVCVVESRSEIHGCEAENGSERRAPAVVLDTPVAYGHAMGASSCYTFGPYHAKQTSIVLQLTTPHGPLYVAWADFEGHGPGQDDRLCFFDASAHGAGAFVECPVPLTPPNPGWGDLLP